MCCTVSTATNAFLSDYFHFFPFAIDLLASIQIGIYGVGCKRSLALFHTSCGLYAENLTSHLKMCMKTAYAHEIIQWKFLPVKLYVYAQYAKYVCIFPNSQVSAMQYKSHIIPPRLLVKPVWSNDVLRHNKKILIFLWIHFFCWHGVKWCVHVIIMKEKSYIMLQELA